MSLKSHIKHVYYRMINESVETTVLLPQQIEDIVNTGCSIYISAIVPKEESESQEDYDVKCTNRHQSLINRIRATTYNFVEGDGNYKYADGTPASEPMVMVWTLNQTHFDLLKQFGMKLMKQFHQESVGICIKNDFYLHYNDGSKDHIGRFNRNVADAPYSTTINGFTFKFGN